MKNGTLRCAILCLLAIGCAVNIWGCSSNKPVDTVNPAMTADQKARLIDKKNKADQ